MSSTEEYQQQQFITEYGEQMNMIRSLGLVPKGFNSIWYNSDYEMVINFVDNKIVISNVKKRLS